MGKNTPGKQKTVRLSEEELKELCQKAVEDGVYKYITVQNQKKKQEWRGLLFRTKKLLENYTKLKPWMEPLHCQKLQQELCKESRTPSVTETCTKPWIMSRKQNTIWKIS